MNIESRGELALGPTSIDNLSTKPILVLNYSRDAFDVSTLHNTTKDYRGYTLAIHNYDKTRIEATPRWFPHTTTLITFNADVNDVSSGYF